jgi:HlyD family secretion protein
MTSDLDLLRIDRAPLPPSNPAGSWPRMGRWVVLGLVFLGAWLFRRPLLQQLDAWTLPQVSLAVAHVPDPASQLKISGVAANGYVVARTRAALSAEEPGVIVEMLVSEGSRVKQGDLLARLDAREREASLRAVAASLVVAQAGVAEAEARVIGTAGTIAARQAELAAGVAGVQSAGAQLLLAEQNLARVQELEQQGAETRARLDQATAEQVRFSADYEAAQANQRSQDAALSLAQAQRGIATAALARAQALVLQREAERDRAVVSLEKRFVRAPFDGIVVLKDAEVGEVVSPNAFGSSSRGAVVTLVDFATLEVQVELSETRLSAVEIGAPATLLLDAFPAEPLAARVDRIWPTANRQKATIEVRLEILSDDERLRPDMGVRVVFGAQAESVSKPEQGVWLPAAVLVRFAGQEGAFFFESGILVFRPLEVAERRGQSFRVKTGLAPGEQAVLDPGPDLADGDRVLVR